MVELGVRSDARPATVARNLSDRIRATEAVSLGMVNSRGVLQFYHTFTLTVREFQRRSTLASEYRKRKGVAYDSWHFCTNCSKWPTSNYDSRTDKPTTGEFCDECLGKKRNDNCK
jgi:hypothetical protein